MDLYQQYRKDLLDIHKSIADHFAELQKSLDAGALASVNTDGTMPRAARLTAIADLIQQGKSCLSHMEMEANDLIPAERISVRAELIEQKKKLSKCDLDLVQMRTKVAAVDRKELLGGATSRAAASSSANAAGREAGGADPRTEIPDELDEQSKKERNAVAAATEKHRGNTDIIMNIERIAVSSNAMLKDAHGNLIKQREVLTDIDQKTRELDADVSDARRIANQMHKVMVQNKAILLGIIGLLVIMIIVIIYVKAVGSGTSTETKVVVILPTSPADGGSGGGGGGLEE